MRPIHALILVVVLALAVAGLAFFLASDATPGKVADPARVEGSTAADPKPPADLSAPEDVDRPAEREATESTPSAAVSVPDPAARVEGGLRGRLVDGRGKPIANARVLCDADGLEGYPIDVEEEEAGAWLARQEARTDAEGRFALSSPSKSQARFGARAPGFAPHDRNVALVNGAKDLGEVVLQDSVILEGRVVDSAHRGVADAKLFRAREPGNGLLILGARAAGALLATTDAQGRFRVDQLATGPWKLLVESEDHPDARHEGQAERPGQVLSGLEIVLEDGADIRGRVTGAPAELLGRLFVRASARPGGGVLAELGDSDGFLFGAERRSKVAADGSFHLRGLKPGQSYRLVARDSKDEFLGRSRSSTVQATAGDSSVVLPYRAETAVTFQVVDAVDGTPIEELTVSAGVGFRIPDLDSAGRPLRKYPGGRVRYTNFQGRMAPDAPAELSVEASGYRTFVRSDLVLVDGQDVDLGVIRLERAPLVRVTVVDAKSGAPVAGAQVGMGEYEPPIEDGLRVERSVSIMVGGDEGDAGDGPAIGNSARTDKDGKAKLTSQPGKTIQLRVTHKGHAPFLSAPIELPAAEDVVQEVRLGPGGTVLVTVRDTKGAPLSGIDVEHRGPGREMGFLMLSGANDERSDAQGVARFEHLMPGEHRFRAGEAGGNGTFLAGGNMVRMASSVTGGAEENDWIKVVVVEGETRSLEVVAPERSSVTGRVTESGRPLSGARVELVSEAESDLHMPFFSGAPNGKSDSDGAYSVADVKVGRYRAEVTHAARAMTWSTTVEVRAGENELDFDLPVAILEGTVKGPDGKPLAGVRVQAERAPSADGGQRTERRVMAVFATDDGDGPEIAFGGNADASPSVVTDAEGRYRLRGVLADVELVVKAKAKDAQPGQSERVRVAADETKSNVDIALETGGAIEVTLTKPGGDPARGCMVRATFEGTGDVEPRHDLAGPKGRVELTGLKPGRWRLSVDIFAAPDGNRPSIPEQTVEVVAGRSAKARFEVP